ncbi:MAG: hypothetical protein IJU44_06235 [Kiritimatiellae bacterium]|nr:hypothetical protein [Kiritimatiellia bacterium]
MIVKMKHLTLLCLENEKAETLERLEKIGCVHLESQPADTEALRCATAKRDSLVAAIAVLEKFSDRKTPDDVQCPAAEQVLAAADERRRALEEAAAMQKAVAAYRPFGSFDPEQARQLGAILFTVPAAEPLPSVDGGLVQEVANDGRRRYGVVIGAAELPEGCDPVSLPSCSLAESDARINDQLRHADELGLKLSSWSAAIPDLTMQLDECKETVNFVAAAATMGRQDSVCWITGWIPEDQTGSLQREQSGDGPAWGISLRDPEPGETPPTLLRPPKPFRPVLALFEGLSISPAYEETDISVPFFAFFSIFFAMLVGDGGYGAIVLALTIWARSKMRKAPSAPFTLLTVFSLATIAWGFLSNTWFGCSLECLNHPVAQWLGDPSYNNMMLLCFTLGVTHLAFARIWNAVMIFPDSKFLAQLGWAGILGFMYCMTCNIVGIFTCPKFMYWVFGVAVVLVFGFSLKKSELKEHGIELGLLPLNIVSTLGDIISYVRLFAVGLASVKVAQNFNDMAVGLGLPLWAKIIPMVLILLLGHGLNLAMAALSILVHAVRLNTLEFSNHKGISWAGYAYKPFKRKSADAANA